MQLDNAAATGSIAVITEDGDLFVEDSGFTPNNGSFGIAAVRGTITLEARDSNGSNDSDLFVENTIVTVGSGVGGEGDIFLHAEHDVRFTAAGDVTAGGEGAVQVVADFDLDKTGAGGELFMADGTLIDAVAGTIFLQADGDITLGGLLTLDDTVDAVRIITCSGGVLDGGNLHTDIVANMVGALVTIDAVTGVGSAGPLFALETQVYAIDVDNTSSGDIRLFEEAAGGDLHLVQLDNAAATGSIAVITEDGDLFVEDSGFTPNNGSFGIAAVRGTITLEARDSNGSNDSDLFVENTIVTVGSGVGGERRHLPACRARCPLYGCRRRDRGR